MVDTLEAAGTIKDAVIGYRREFHRIPELAFSLEKTTGKVQEYLKEMGIESTKCGKAGIAAVIEAEDTDGPVIGLRADMDAMPVREETGLPFASEQENRMHCCGHDAHIAVLLGTARLLAENRREWKGRVKLIFQPAEEIVSGAIYMIENGALENPEVDMVLGLHIWQPLESGKLGIRKGAFMASSDNFRITVHGKASHGAMPHEGIDAISAAADFIHGIQHVLTRVLPSNENYVLTFGKITGGVKENAIAERVEIEGTFRTFNMEVRNLIERKIRDYLESKALTHGITWEYEIMSSTPPTINDNELTNRVIKAAVTALGEERVVEYGPVMPSEDFSEYGKHVPAVFFFVGGGDEKHTYPHHHSKFDIDEEALPLGVATLLQAVIDIPR